MSHQDEIRDAVEKAFAVAEMQQGPGWAALMADVGRMVRAKEQAVLAGRLDAQDYAVACGWLAGARFVLDTQERLEELANALRSQQ